MIRTRFRPSANGPLHFGGAHVARLNWWYAQARGGQFVLLVDDVVPVHKYGRSEALSARMREYAENFRRDLDWLGYGPDELVFASAYTEAHHEACERLGISLPLFGEVPCLNTYVYNLSGSGVTASYVPWLTVGRVTDDHELGITEFVRGGDLVGEAQLYDYLARQLYGEGYRIAQEYVDIIVEPAGDSVCSKSDGSAGIAAYREAGVSAEQIREALENMIDLPASYGAPHASYRQVDAKYLRPARRKR